MFSFSTGCSGRHLISRVYQQLTVDETAQFDQRGHGDPRLIGIRQFRTSGCIQHPPGNHKLHVLWMSNEKSGRSEPAENFNFHTVEWMVMVVDFA